MRRGMSLLAVLVLVCFTTMAFGANEPAAKTDAAKSDTGKATVYWGKITKLDTEKNEVTIKTKKGNETVPVKPEDLATLKVGEKVKATMESGANTATIEKMKGKAAKKKSMKKEEAPAAKPAQ